LDTGVEPTHIDFRPDQINHLFDAFQSPPYVGDPNGHGTQIAGIIGGLTSGIAKGVKIQSIRIANEIGEASIDDIIWGLDYIVG
jgi:subtilisin family serine protease